MLKTVNLSKAFGGVRAVDKCTIELESGRINCLIGPNGSGKTTLFDLITGLIAADSGDIYLNGEKINNLNCEQIANIGISRLFQQPRLFKNLTVKDNLVIAFNNDDTMFWRNLFNIDSNKVEKEKEIDKLLNLMKMKEYTDKLARELSYGQKRLVELLRVSIKPHKILMLDEPMAGTSPIIQKEIKDFLLHLNRIGKTIFMIEHNMQFVFDIADWVFVMDRGQIVMKGKPDEMRNDFRLTELFFRGKNVRS